MKSHLSSQSPAPVAPTIIAPPRGYDKKRSNQKNSHIICSFCKNHDHSIDQCHMCARIFQRSAALAASRTVPPSDSASIDLVTLITPTFSIVDLQALFS